MMMNPISLRKRGTMSIRALLILTAFVLGASSCSTTEEKGTMESVNQAVADSIINSAPSDSAAIPVELSPEAEEKH